MSEEHAVAYRALRARVTELVSSAESAAIVAPSPATPSWSAHDVLAHMVGVTDDVVHGRLDGVATDPWTAAQVESRRDTSVAAMLAEWETLGPQFETLMAGVPAKIAGQAVFDAMTHEHDLRRALDRPGARDSDAIELSWEWIVGARNANSGTILRVVTEHGEEILGDGEPRATVRASRFELLRAQTGRRSRSEIAEYEWEPQCMPELLIAAPEIFTIARRGPRRVTRSPQLAQHVHDVAADHVEVVAALLHDDRREFEGGNRAANARVVVADEAERVGVFERGVDAEGNNESVGSELPDGRERARERGPYSSQLVPAGNGKLRLYPSPAPQPRSRANPRKNG